MSTSLLHSSNVNLITAEVVLLQYISELLILFSSLILSSVLPSFMYCRHTSLNQGLRVIDFHLLSEHVASCKLAVGEGFHC